MENEKLTISLKGFKGKGAVDLLHRDAQRRWTELLAVGQALVSEMRPVLRHLPYRIKLVRVTPKAAPARFHLRWALPGGTTIWYDIERDLSVPAATKELLRSYNVRIEEVNACQAVLLATMVQTHRLQHVHAGTVYNRLTKGPGAARRRLALAAQAQVAASASAAENGAGVSSASDLFAATGASAA